AELAKMAGHVTHMESVVDVDDQRFLKPDDMIEEIRQYCMETDQLVPTTPDEMAKCIFDSLALSYQNAVKQIEYIHDKKFSQINVIGGGSQNEVLNQLIADHTSKDVIAGPTEATAIGNIIAQLIALDEIADLHDAKQIIKNS